MKSLALQKGFTLFEMVIAVSIFAIIGVMAFGGLGQMTKTGQSIADANQRLSELQFAVVYFQRDWTQVSPRKIRNQFGDEESNIVIENDIITFTHSGWSNLLGHKRSTLQRVQYQVVNNQLRRRHWFSLDQGIAEAPFEVVLLNDVEAMEINFQDGLGQPIIAWPRDVTSQAGKPILLELSLNLKDMGEITRLLEIPDGLL